MSMTLDVGDDRDDELDDRDDTDRDDDDDDGEDDDRSTRGNGRRTAKPKDDDTDDASDDDEDGLDDLDEAGLRSELKKARAALSRAGKQTARQRSARKALEKRISAIEGDLDDGDESDDDGDEKGKAPTAKTVQRAADRARKQARREADEEHRKDLINLRAESALERAGVSPRNVRLVMRELDYDQVDFDAKSRAVDGLDDEIDRLKDEFPDLFRRPRTERRRINGGDDRDGRTKRKKAMTATEIQAAQLRGH